ncbi:MAG: glycosyltransferase family A protein [Bauldia sp.]
MRISLIIPAYNEEAYLGGCLDSILAHAKGRLHEIIVVDNASTDGTSAIAASRPGVRVVHEPEKGLLFARQRGYLEATGEYVAYLDADTRMPPGWVDRVESAFSSRPDAVSLSGPARYWDGSPWRRWILDAAWWLVAPPGYWLTGYMIYGANFVVRRSALDAIGGFDRSVEFYGEDTTLARSLSRHGKVLFRLRFFIYSSARRFAGEGMLRSFLVYFLNFVWPALFGRPFTGRHKDVRSSCP